MSAEVEKLWKVDVTPDLLNADSKGTMTEHLGILVTEVGPDYLVGTMPVDHRTKQPMGLLHGGASVVLAETLGSIGGNLCVNLKEQAVVGLDINANHIKSARSGVVTGVAKPLHIGKRTQIWEIKISNEQDELVCISRLTLAVIDRAKK